MDTLGTKMEYRNIHVRLCPLHAAAPELYQALEGLVTEATEYFQTGNANALSFTAARAALAKARGEVSSTSNAVPPSPPPASSGLSKDKGGK